MLKPRLLACAKQVRFGRVAADIGTDHGFLPIYLIRREICPRVIACDLREEPLKRARENIKAAGLEDQIELRLSDGLQKLHPKEASDIILAGMGGELMAGILAAASWLQNSDYRLILQPMSRAEMLRAYLFDMGFAIRQEAALFDAGRVYTVIAAVYTGIRTPTEGAAPYLGGLPEHPSPAAVEYLKRQQKLLDRRIEGLKIRGATESEISRLSDVSKTMLKTISSMEGKEMDS